MECVLRPNYIKTVSILFYIYMLYSPLFGAGMNRIVHTVKRGESLSHIAVKYGVSVENIASWNKIKSPDHIFAGQSLKIYIQPKERALPENDAPRIYLTRPVDNWSVVVGYRPYGDSRNYGWICDTKGGREFRSAQSGVVVKIDYLRGYGRYILIDHGNGWHSLYSNIDEIKVNTGQKVAINEVIGTVRENRIFFLLSYQGKPVNPSGYFN